MPHQAKRPPLEDALRYAQIGTTLVAPMVALGAVGFIMDRKLGSGPWLLLAGLVLGMVAGFVSFFRLVLNRDDGDDSGRAGR